ncbi:MAG: hypothetical protein QGF20_14545 [Alphaproteobacteria bacterium]|jgi:hypothetical protein|nr:hypothetical protein [Alphaproteobacteria bacterium]|tara:strand:+ start:736 stop:954 length:219 start_codon:yes stop_codon:yes gene_type:complete
MKYYVAYFLLLVLIVGLPAAILAAPWNIDWAYWLRPRVIEWTVVWSVVVAALLWGFYRLTVGWSEGRSLEKQ